MESKLWSVYLGDSMNPTALYYVGTEERCREVYAKFENSDEYDVELRPYVYNPADYEDSCY